MAPSAQQSVSRLLDGWLMAQLSPAALDPAKRIQLISSAKKIAEESDSLLDEQVRRLRDERKALKEDFLKIVPIRPGRNKHAIVDCWVQIIYAYRALCLFPDPEIQTHFKKWQFPTPRLKWMVPLEEILTELENIKGSNKFLILKHEIFAHIRNHLHTKIFFEVLDWGFRTLGKSDGDSLKKVFPHIRRIRKRNEAIKDQSPIASRLAPYLKAIKKQKPQKNIMQDLLKSSRGKTEYFDLRKILSAGIQIDLISESEYLREMFDLFRLICKDKKLLSEAEFEEWCQKKKQKKQEKPYDGHYDTYKSEKLKELIFKK